MRPDDPSDNPAQMENAFTCTGAYAMLIMCGLKCVENRSAMPTPRRGRCAMSVSRRFCRREYDALCAWLDSVSDGKATALIPPWEDVREWPGHVVGVMDYEAVAQIPSDESRARQCRFWNEGYANWWLLSNVRRLPSPIPCRGNVGMWRLPAAISSEIAAQLSR